MENPLPTLAVPGQQLATTSTYLPGAGTHVQNGIICASIPGPVFVEQLPGQTKSKASKSILSVLRSGVGNIGPNGVIQKAPAATTTTTVAGTKKPKYNTLPAVDSVVLARVTRVQKRQVMLSILVVLDDASTSDNDNIAAILTSAANPENQSTSDELRFQALIRKEDVRAVEKDRVVLEEMFRVGDVVRGSIISLGDQSFYYLTTARNDLGVVMARSDAGNMMFPVSWKEMKDPVTGASESRKVARPF
ncbi:exosome 3'-_5 exonuclease subunit ski4 (Csl4) [Talaromyces marneffei ATCC 18224]|uniref:Exosome complex subunit Csl4, putative n=1 Tax=Talaromyces marneffei (strain ATCC 18224 / CBS 334.59 / QM 7333) TaxID=441960 RepID=B6Q6A9_TALMQ|nr:uncharacterized protein EYB26_001864 [Talaromyces marneffei]EEA28584.1 exosome complex subunit Csl4, putative [Talaromyces marneffei ATCC 18224]KAE8555794.1 hypothetical protein EYB25_000492 [Talaromyces marneffei]QGA14211.1 hypothetical protein EYB26_001864 [Talaromyces marneffei]